MQRGRNDLNVPPRLCCSKPKTPPYVYTYISPIDDDHFLNFNTATVMSPRLPPRHTSQLSLSLSLPGAFDLFPVKMMFHPLARSFFLLLSSLLAAPHLRCSSGSQYHGFLLRGTFHLGQWRGGTDGPSRRRRQPQAPRRMRPFGRGKGEVGMVHVAFPFSGRCSVVS